MEKWDREEKVFHAKEEIIILQNLLKEAKNRLINIRGYDEQNWWYNIPFINWLWDYLNN